MDLTIYDRLSDSMLDYLYNYGWHFNKALCEYAVSKMYKSVNGRERKLEPFTKQEVDDMFARNGIELRIKGLYDYVYVANMCKADFYGSSIEDERHLCLYINDMLGDVDGYEGIVFNRWFADTRKKGLIINWEDFL